MTCLALGPAQVFGQQPKFLASPAIYSHNNEFDYFDSLPGRTTGGDDNPRGSHIVTSGLPEIGPEERDIPASPPQTRYLPTMASPGNPMILLPRETAGGYPLHRKRMLLITG